MIDPRRVKLGKLAPKVEPKRRLLLEKYLRVVPQPPAECDWTCGITDWGMMLNDRLGCCTIAAKAHAIQTWTMNLGCEVTVPDSAILAAYQSECGYDPAQPATDQGGVEVEVLNIWRQKGFADHNLFAYADPKPSDRLHVEQSIWMFGGVYIGVSLPLTAQRQEVWDVVSGDGSAPGSWGGHAVFCPAYTPTGPTCITWGGLQLMTWAFWDKYCDESHTLFSYDWLDSSLVNPHLIDKATLEADLLAVSS
jgi:hypothetical protein